MQNDIRSPHPQVYSPTASYPHVQPLAQTHTHTSHYPSRVPVAAPAPQHHQTTPISHSSVERYSHIHRSGVPYARNLNAPEMPSPVDDGLTAEPLEPTIKKKRKRADAHQLQVLNETYNRTAFPSTEERAALAKQLDMTPRSVQIWSVHLFCRRLSYCL